MHWRFDPLFSIKVYHTKYLIPNGSTEPPTAEDFTLEPTSTTERRLKELGWVFKAQPGVCTIYGEKVFEANGNASLRYLPDAEESFTFFLNLSNAAILNETKPYVLASKPVVVPKSDLPAFSGRSRVLYFDNINPSPQSGGEFSLSTGRVDVDQFASVAPISFSFNKAAPGVSTLKFTALTPTATIAQFAVNQPMQTAQVTLGENAYHLEQVPGGPSETMVIMAENLAGKALGVVRIFQPVSGSWEPLRRYRIDFEAV